MTLRPALPPHIAELYPFTSRWTGSDGYTLHHIDEGPPDAPVVLLLHGNPTWSFVYRDFVPPITAAGFRVIAPDYLGFGLSDKPGEEHVYAIERHIDRVLALLDELGVTRVVAFCQDWGGPIGLGAGLRRAGLIGGLVLANTFWGQASAFHRSVPLWRALHGPVAGALLLGRRGMFVNALRLSAPQDMPDAVWDAYRLPFVDAASRMGTLAFPRAISLGPGHPTHDLSQRILDALPTWDVPVRLVWGAADAVFTPDGEGQRFVDLLPRATGLERIEGARHFVQEYAPDTCAAACVAVAREAYG